MSASGIPDEYINAVKLQFAGAGLSDEDIKMLRNQYCGQVQQTMRADQWNSLKQQLDPTSDIEAFIWCAAYFNFPQTEQEMEDAIMRKVKENGVSAINTALHMTGTEFAGRYIIDYVTEKMKNSRPSEEFLFTNKTDCEIQSFWMQDTGCMNGIPSDLLFSKKISVTDCIITVDETKDFSYGSVCRGRVCVFPDYGDIVDRIDSGTLKQDERDYLLGTVTLYMDNPHPWKMIVPFGSQSKGSILICFPPYAEDVSPDERENLSMVTCGMITQMASGMMATWYGIEFSLYAGIHPESRKLQ